MDFTNSPRIFLKTKDAIYPVRDSQNHIVGTAFVTESTKQDTDLLMVLAIIPDRETGNNMTYFTKLRDGRKLDFRKHSGVLLLNKDEVEVRKSSLSGNFLRNDDPQNQDGQQNNVHQIHAIKVNSSGHEVLKYLVEKVEGGDGPKYKLKDGQTLDDDVRLVGAPLTKFCNDRYNVSFRRTSSKRVIGVVESEVNGILSVMDMNTIKSKIMTSGASTLQQDSGQTSSSSEANGVCSHGRKSDDDKAAQVASALASDTTDGRDSNVCRVPNSGDTTDAHTASVPDNDKLTPREKTRLSQRLGSCWSDLAGLLNIGDETKQNILKSILYLDLSSKLEEVLRLYNERGDFSRKDLARLIDGDLNRPEEAEAVLTGKYK